ncbi:MAG: Gfo/Idh/MocA family protein [Ferrimicrobium acidiphilum]
MKETLRLGVIGAGSWAIKSYLPLLEERGDEVGFVAAATVGEQRQALLKNRWRFDHVYSDYRSVLDHDLDICIVTSPAALHFEHAKAALDAGCHVLVEKPFTVLPDDAWELCEFADAKGRELIVAFGWNYLPMIRESKALLSSSSGIGQIETLSLYMASGLREMLTGRGAYPDASHEVLPDPKTWSDPTLSGGGYGAGQLSHIFALMRSVLGTGVEEVFSLMHPEPSRDKVELHDAALLRLTDGGIGAVVGSSMHSGAGKGKHQVEIRVIGTEGQFHLDLERERSS